MTISANHRFGGNNRDEVILSILGLCSCVDGNDRQRKTLLGDLEGFNDWNILVEHAEIHGLAPLLYHHLQQVGVTIPATARRMLQSLVVRHRQANTIRINVLKEILAAFKVEGIAVCTLKGAALAHLLYSNPEMRPMRDLDLLVRQAQAQKAQTVLQNIGFDAPRELTSDLPGSSHHLSNATRQDQGLLMSVEIHHHLFSEAGRLPQGALDDFNDLREYDIDGISAYSLGIEDMLGHLYGHSFTNPRFISDLRLINVADMVGLIEKLGEEMDWDKLKMRYPRLLKVLPLLNLFTPMERLSLVNPIPMDYPRWPRAKLPRSRSLGQKLKDSLYDVVFMPRWWLHFQYGNTGVLDYHWHRWMVHPWRMLALYMRTGVELVDRRKRKN